LWQLPLEAQIFRLPRVWWNYSNLNYWSWACNFWLEMQLIPEVHSRQEHRALLVLIAAH
jgi:hypothetical protein